MTTDQGLGKGRYLKKVIERAIMKENEEFYKTHVFSKKKKKWVLK